ncbi:LysM peptidoglycan-binding domain-containing protein [Thermoactinomyces sp. DSM 45892]|uniref:LysM peptidoglycan-binding domain-containing protein n=1 Tax=Thermoactinomyces sp. DSM 45892 TaxID=1882753 RepID=UPI000897F5CD|nr:LysM peptidoglycan-binding domain-containing protein [Thermoactinomyces sp. DSM 45892]SDZ26364.1 3D domain-containing protein [Thermoactinomyces sp. DSM 45892]
MKKYLLVTLVIVLLAIGAHIKNDGSLRLDPVPVAAKEMESSSANTSSYVKITIQKGDTLYRLAKTHGTSVQKIVELNQIADPSKVRVGQSIRIMRNGKQVVQNSVPSESKTESSIQTSWHRGKVLGEFSVVAMTPPIQSKSSLSGVTIGVDPKVIPIGSRVYLPTIGYRTARDAEGRVHSNQIELYVESTAKARQMGTKEKMLLEVVN